MYLAAGSVGTVWFGTSHPQPPLVLKMLPGLVMAPAPVEKPPLCAATVYMWLG